MTDLGVIYTMLVFQAFKMQDLWGYGDFHLDYSRKPERPDGMFDGQSP
jgi:hypothetical protein